jgi:hypothetical protein
LMIYYSRPLPFIDPYPGTAALAWRCAAGTSPHFA